MARKRRKKTDDEIADAEAAGIKTDVRESDQAGDLQGLSEDAEADSQSVRELAAEGQTFEANVVSAIENAPPADAAEVTTHEVPEDDVPPEYLERQRDEPKE
jgi:N utilization substance protein A